MLGVVVSRADEASVAIGRQLRGLVDATPVDAAPPAAAGYRAEDVVVREFEERHLDLERPVAAFPPVDLLAVASKHAGETGPLLTAHHTGNVGPADHGGEPNALARAAPNALSTVLDAMATYAPDGYDVGMECTHHGPTDVGAPSLFVEVGSDPEAWTDPAATEAVARAILDLRGVSPDRPSESEGTRRHLVGFGGGHYTPRFERIVRETDWAVGHVAADWGLEALGDPTSPAARTVVDAAFEASAARVGLVAGDRPRLRDVIRDLGYRPVGETWVRETSGVPLALVEDVEAALGPIEEGVRLGDRAGAAPDDLAVTGLPPDLVETACGIDRSGTRAAIAGASVAFETTDGGSGPTGRVALATDDDRADVIDALADVLRERFDEVVREGAELVARETAFDPERAATLGVPEGPKFGRLAAGETVEVEGREIPPEAVTTERERRFNCQ